MAGNKSRFSEMCKGDFWLARRSHSRCGPRSVSRRQKLDLLFAMPDRCRQVLRDEIGNPLDEGGQGFVLRAPTKSRQVPLVRGADFDVETLIGNVAVRRPISRIEQTPTVAANEVDANAAEISCSQCGEDDGRLQKIPIALRYLAGL